MRPEFKRLIIAAYRLPFSVTQTKSGYRKVQSSGGLVSAILSLAEKFKSEENEMRKILWVGYGDFQSKEIPANQLKNEHFQIAPVTIPKKTHRLFYEGFCNDFIWPLFHYFPSYYVSHNEYYDAYRETNNLYCKQLETVVRPGDFVWIHDYQLMLLPAMLRKKIPGVTSGFFLHIPFPSFEIFRLIPRRWREDMIHGMLGADLIGFHTHDYLQHFLKSVRRTTGFECRQNIIHTAQRVVKADAFPIGIDYDKFHQAALSPSVLNEKKKIYRQLHGQKLIFSVDRLDYTKGLLNRLRAYELFLDRNPQWLTKVVFNMVVVPSRDNIDRYREMRKEIEYNVGRINGKYSSLSWRPVIYQYKSLRFDELVALYDLSDVGLITPLRDGMNLVAKEYVACQVQNHGVIILSEMAGAAAELSEGIIINPADDEETSQAIKKALEMSQKEKISRMNIMQKRLQTYNVFTWAEDFFNQVYDTKEQQKAMNVRLMNKTIAEKIRFDFHHARKRIFFLDYDGTLVPFTKYPENASIKSSTLEIIKTLTADSRNTVVIVSGRNREFLERQFSGTPVALIAEHGCFIRMPGKEWQTTVNIDTQWKSSIMPVLQDYVYRCTGSFIEEKAGSLAWHYRNADSDFAQLRLHELRDDLSEIIRHKTTFDILEGSKVLEVKSGRYDKGQAALLLLANNDYDFIFATGDDKTDEDLFRTLPETALTIKIGTIPSYARFNLTDIPSLLKLLNQLSE